MDTTRLVEHYEADHAKDGLSDLETLFFDVERDLNTYLELHTAKWSEQLAVLGL